MGTLASGAKDWTEPVQSLYSLTVNSHLKNPTVTGFSQTLKNYFIRLTQPTSLTEDTRRQEYILNVLLLSTLALTSLAFIYVFIDTLSFGSTYQGSRLTPVLIALIIFFGLYLLTRLRFYRPAAYGFIGLIFLFATYPLVVWGIGLPQGLLMYALGLAMSAVLISTRFAAIAMIMISIGMVALAQLQANQIIIPNSYWVKDTGGLDDALVFIATLGAITLVSWLSNREIEKSLQRARDSERVLQKERDQLELIVERRTSELRRSQLEKIRELYRFAEFGRLSSELLHDLVNPLTAVSLNLEELSATRRSALLKRAIEGTKYMENFILAARKQLQQQDELTEFDLVAELNQATQLLQSRSRQAKVKLTVAGPARCLIYGNPLKFHQMVFNLLTNAIDAYAGRSKLRNRQVTIRVTSKPETVEVEVQDWGEGIPSQELRHIFEPFYSTKHSEQGTGIGLAIVKRIVEQDFSGQVQVTSNRKDGTRFRVMLPLGGNHDPSAS